LKTFVHIGTWIMCARFHENQRETVRGGGEAISERNCTRRRRRSNMKTVWRHQSLDRSVN